MIDPSRTAPGPQGNDGKGKTGIRRLIKALIYSLQGMKAALRTESAFRQEVLLAVILIPLALALPISYAQKALLSASVLLVLIVELLNSAIEATVDRISLERHDLAKRAKDFASAAVLLSIVLCALVWMLVLVDTFA